jgi:adenosine deaminase
VSAIDLRHEFEVAAPAAGLSPEQIRQAQINALETAFLSDQEKDAIRAKRKHDGPGGTTAVSSQN